MSRVRDNNAFREEIGSRDYDYETKNNEGHGRVNKRGAVSLQQGAKHGAGGVELPALCSDGLEPLYPAFTSTLHKHSYTCLVCGPSNRCKVLTQATRVKCCATLTHIPTSYTRMPRGAPPLPADTARQQHIEQQQAPPPPPPIMSTGSSSRHFHHHPRR